jgi:uncharacterized protein (TIGR02646 family)
MIRIHKCTAPPNLVRNGEDHARELCAAYDGSAELYRNGERKMMVRRSIYASDAVKVALEACHHGKCCYCETLIPKPYGYGHVEHWRPKESWRQGPDDTTRAWPGYYWLAYNWDNLLWSCLPCNSKKNDLFPLDNPATRARHHGMPVENETPAILKPDGDQDPRDHITFRLEVPVGLTALGRKTIEVLGLDSEEHEPRRTHLKEIELARKMCIGLMSSVDSVARQWAERSRKFVEEAVRPEKPYSAMVAAYMEANPLPDRSA